MNALQKLRSLHTEITQSGNGLKIVDAWTLAERLISRMPCDQALARQVCKEKNSAGLDALILSMERPSLAATPSPIEGVSEDDMAAALRAFRKRLKLVRLDDESRLGGRYTSGGHRSSIDAIQPPDGFGKEVWQALVQSGKLKYTGQGFYAEP